MEPFPDVVRHVGSFVVVDRTRTTRQNNGLNIGIVAAKLVEGNGAGIELTVNMEFTDATGNEMGILGTKIEDGNLGSVIIDCRADMETMNE